MNETKELDDLIESSKKLYNLKDVKQEDIFNVNDFVTILPSKNVISYNKKAPGNIIQITTRKDLDRFINGEKVILDNPLNLYGINYILGDIRHATKEEIDDYNKGIRTINKTI